MRCETENVVKMELLLSDVVSLVCIVISAVIFSRTEQQKAELKAIRSELNVTSQCNQEVLIFNRVPKVGSQTMNHLIADLRARNNFTGFTSMDGMPESMLGGETVFLPQKEMRKMAVDTLATTEVNKRPFAFLKHQNFFNFSEFGYQSPIYINFVRHPVERMISWYYYIRAPWYLFEETTNSDNTTRVDKKDNLLKLREYKTNFEDCFRRKQKGCHVEENFSVHNNPWMPDMASQMTFFCGHGPQCDAFNSKRMLDIAKSNVEKHFAVVGVLEDWDMSLEVLEAYVPRFFAEAREAYATNEEIRHVNKNIYKPKTEKAVKRELAAKMGRELEFYYFCRQRLKRQYWALKDGL